MEFWVTSERGLKMMNVWENIFAISDVLSRKVNTSKWVLKVYKRPCKLYHELQVVIFSFATSGWYIGVLKIAGTRVHVGYIVIIQSSEMVIINICTKRYNRFKIQLENLKIRFQQGSCKFLFIFSVCLRLVGYSRTEIVYLTKKKIIFFLSVTK